MFHLFKNKSNCNRFCELIRILYKKKISTNPNDDAEGKVEERYF